MAFRTAAAIVLLACLTEASASAQQPSMVAFWERLQGVESSTQVGALPAPDDVDDVIAESLRLVREYELDPDRSTAYEARWDLRRAVERNPRSAEHHLALALLLRRGPDAVVRLDDTDYNTFVDPRSLASAHTLRSLRRALELDPHLELAAVELARFAVERHDADLLMEADSALARMRPAAEVLLQRAAIALERQDASSALRFATAAVQAGADPSRAAHARAVALLLDPATEKMGAATYIGGLENATEAGIAEYHAASASTFTLAETATWDTLAPERRADWLRERWEIRSLLNGVSPAERLGVHFRRLYTAYSEFPLFSPMRESANKAGLAILLGEDLRRHGVAVPGVMLTRYGEPDRLRWLGICGEGIPYLRADTMSKANPLDEFLPPAAYRPVDGMDILLHEDSKAMREIDCNNRTEFREFARTMMEGERYRPAFGVPLHAFTEIYAFRAPDGADIVTAVTLPRQDITVLGATDASVTIATAVAFIDTIARRTSRAERLLQFRMPDTTVTHILLAATAHTTLHGTLDVRLTVGDPERRTGAVLAGVHTIPDFSNAGPQLSDLVIAPAVAGDRLRRGDVSLAVAAGRKYATGEEFNLYYEIYGLEDDAAYRTRIVVAPVASALWRAARRITGAERDVITLEFDGRAASPDPVYGVQELRTVGTSRLGPGTYRLRVEIEDVRTGTTAVRERLFDIE